MAKKSNVKAGAKASTSSPPPAASTAPESADQKPLLESLATVVALLTLAAFSSPISLLTLSPVYGSIPSAIFHERGITFCALIAYVLARALNDRGTAIGATRWIAPWAYYIPVLQYVLFQYSGLLGPTYGPLVTESLTYFPLLVLTFMAVVEIALNMPTTTFGDRSNTATPMVASYLVFTGMETAAHSLVKMVVGTSDFYSRTGLQMMAATMMAVVTRSSLLMFAVPALIHTMFANPHHYADKTTKLLNHTLLPYQYSVLERADSVTGYVSVVSNAKDGWTAMRCDHSILGGEWWVTDERKSSGQTVKETIYSVFTMLEAVRMIKTDVYVPDEERDALFIGLGIGTAPKAFIKHGINTTIVEIDPMVHHFATKYFDLPTNHTKVISDAVTWTEAAAKTQPESYDYIVHDVFTGGAEPTALFTLEFLQSLDTLLKEDGSIAINYAADITLPSARIILNTIHSVFPSCRIYRDTIPDESPETFLNMIVFCVKNPDRPIVYRLPKNEDYQGSMARRSFLPPDDGLEIHLRELGIVESRWKDEEVLRRGNESMVEKYHRQAATHHWAIMRTVMPDIVWEMW